MREYRDRKKIENARVLAEIVVSEASAAVVVQADPVAKPSYIIIYIIIIYNIR